MTVPYSLQPTRRVLCTHTITCSNGSKLPNQPFPWMEVQAAQARRNWGLPETELLQEGPASTPRAMAVDTDGAGTAQ